MAQSDKKEVIKAQRGTQDVLPANVHKWQYIERKVLEIAGNFGFTEIRFPTFEDTNLFQRSVGDTTDVVQKEMYTFPDKGGRSITLRPEGTAGTVRAVLENGLLNEALPQKLCYITSCFRYEKPQAGRLREFHQFGVEMFGAKSPAADAEVISLGSQLLSTFGMDDIVLEINSIGCPECRPHYHKALKSYFEGRKGDLCPTCLDRLEKNPMRILDCKSPVCSEIAKGAPVSLDYLCDECKTHFDGVKARLDAIGIVYKVNPKIVRGLDYYTKTVFEFLSGAVGSQSAVCAGGRYDGLVEEMGGNKTPGLGFAMGIERLLLAMENKKVPFPETKKCDLYIGSLGEKGAVKALGLCSALRDEGFFAECDLMERGLKAQMKYADKIGARFSLVLGDNEIETDQAELKNMATGEKTTVNLGSGLLSALYDVSISSALDSMAESLEGLDLPINFLTDKEKEK